MTAIAPLWGWFAIACFVGFIFMLILGILAAAKHGDEQAIHITITTEHDWDWKLDEDLAEYRAQVRETAGRN